MLAKTLVKLLLALSTASLFGSALAQAPPSVVNYQGRVTRASGQPLPDGTAQVEVNIFDSPSGGALLWDSGVKTVAVRSGVFALALQGNGATTPALSPATFATGFTWFEVVVWDGNTRRILSPRQLIAGVPWSLWASTVSDEAVTTQKIAPEAVTTDRIANRAVTANQLAFDSVLTEMIADGAVHQQKLADSIVSTAKLEDGAVTAAKVAVDSGILQKVTADLLSINGNVVTGTGFLEYPAGTDGFTRIGPGSVTVKRDSTTQYTEILGQGLNIHEGAVHFVTNSNQLDVKLTPNGAGDLTLESGVRGGQLARVFAHSFNTPSSLRFKSRVKPLGPVLSELLALTAVKYRNKGEDNVDQVGLIAEEVARSFPELVAFETDGATPRAVNYPQFTAVLLRGLQEQNMEIQALRNENKVLAERESATAQRVERLERLVRDLSRR